MRDAAFVGNDVGDVHRRFTFAGGRLNVGGLRYFRARRIRSMRVGLYLK